MTVVVSPSVNPILRNIPRQKLNSFNMSNPAYVCTSAFTTVFILPVDKYNLYLNILSVFYMNLGIGCVGLNKTKVSAFGL